MTEARRSARGEVRDDVENVDGSRISSERMRVWSHSLTEEIGWVMGCQSDAWPAKEREVCGMAVLSWGVMARPWCTARRRCSRMMVVTMRHGGTRSHA